MGSLKDGEFLSIVLRSVYLRANWIFCDHWIIQNLICLKAPVTKIAMFSLRSSSYDLRGNYILSLSKPKTTTYGLNAFSFFSAKQWNALPNFFRTSFFADFKTKIQDVTFM